jgi:hypothetical protein
MADTTRPCPYCGEQIKTNAVKCRFCGEFIDDDEEEEEDEEEESGAMKWVAPVNRNGFAILAGYLGILALVPVPFILYGFFAAEGQMKRTERVLYIGAYINIALGLIAILGGALAILMVYLSGKRGLGRAIFAIAAGIVGALGYWVLVDHWFVGEVVDINKKPLPQRIRKQAPEGEQQSSPPARP